MRALFDLFFDICLLRRGPQDVPVASSLFFLCLLAYLLAGYMALLASIAAATPISAFVVIVLDTLLISALCYGVLRVLQHSERWQQTLTALWGCGALLQLIALPLGIWFDRAVSSESPMAEIPLLLSFGILFWSLAVTAHILRHAFDVTFVLGLSYALAYLFLSWSMADWLLVINA